METEKLLLELVQKTAKIEALMESDLKGVKMNVQELNAKMDNITEKINKVEDLEIVLQTQDTRISKLENTHTWFIRSVASILIAGAMYVLYGLK